MNDTEKKTTTEGAERPAGAAEAVTHDPAQEAAETPNFERLSGRDMVSIETEMQMNNEYALAPEISRSFQGKMAAKAAGIGSDVLEAMPLKDFNKITNAARSFLIDTGF